MKKVFLILIIMLTCSFGTHAIQEQETTGSKVWIYQQFRTITMNVNDIPSAFEEKKATLKQMYPNVEICFEEKELQKVLFQSGRIGQYKAVTKWSYAISALNQIEAALQVLDGAPILNETIKIYPAMQSGKYNGYSIEINNAQVIVFGVDIKTHNGQSTIMHELTHAMYNSLAKEEQKSLVKEIQSLNPEGFRYGKWVSPFIQDTYFVRDYSMTNVKEDIATVGEAFLFSDKNRSDVINSKLELLKRYFELK